MSHAVTGAGTHKHPCGNPGGLYNAQDYAGHVSYEPTIPVLPWFRNLKYMQGRDDAMRNATFTVNMKPDAFRALGGIVHSGHAVQDGLPVVGAADIVHHGEELAIHVSSVPGSTTGGQFSPLSALTETQTTVSKTTWTDFQKPP